MTRGDEIAREGDTGGDVTSPHGFPPVGAATTADNYPGAGAPAPGAFWWTREEDEILAPYTTRAFRAEDIRRLAAQLGRTPQAVKRHVSYMRERLRAGLPLHGSKGRVPSLSADEYRIIAEMRGRGATLSTGERQLLAIARALAGEPHFVVLDEATASVDSETEHRIEEAKENLLQGRSALVIAHRLSTVRRADRILVMHRGELRESGTHEELLRRGGIYARLYTLQFEHAGPAAG